MVGFLSACIGEIITGRGALGQLNLYTPLSSPMVDALALGLVVYSALGALNPLSPTFSDENQRDIKKRPRGPTNDPTMYPGEPKKFLGITNFGFTKKNELFVGRVAMLGFAFAIIGEKLTGGKGPLAQIGIPLGQPLNPTYAGLALAVWIGFFGLAAIGYNNFGQTDGDEGIY
jgi:photosystem II protein